MNCDKRTLSITLDSSDCDTSTSPVTLQWMDDWKISRITYQLIHSGARTSHVTFLSIDSRTSHIMSLSIEPYTSTSRIISSRSILAFQSIDFLPMTSRITFQLINTDTRTWRIIFQSIDFESMTSHICVQSSNSDNRISSFTFQTSDYDARSSPVTLQSLDNWRISRSA
jgi:hypothetical protein